MRLTNAPTLIAFILTCSSAYSQELPVPLHSRTAEIRERWDILGIDTGAHVTNGLVFRATSSDAALHCTGDAVFLDQNEADIQYLLDENPLCNAPQTAGSYGHRVREKPLLRYFFKTPSQFYSINSDDFKLSVNPMLHLHMGRNNLDNTFPIFRNERGIQVYGELGKKLQFYTSLQEIQARLHPGTRRWVTEHAGYPGYALTKEFGGSIWKKINGFDTNISEAWIMGKPVKQVRFQFGHGRHFFGNGYRSMILSDAVPVYLFLRLDTKVWKLHYTNLFTEMSASQPFGLSFAEKKYLAAHYLDLKLTKNWSVGIYEATVFSRDNGFELQYLNPVIFYRSVEGMIGSPDNALVGANTRLNLFKTAQVYGQLLLDEFYSRAIFNPTERGWWANKAGVQLGAKYLNVLGINRLDLQVEYNQVRPYTYSHESQRSSYTHYGQSLAHPLGSNFRETLGILKYQPAKRVFLEAKTFFWTKGHDQDTSNYGSLPWKSYNTRIQEYGNYIGQGDKTTVRLFQFNASYMLAHNLFLDLQFAIRNEDSQSNLFDQNLRFGTVGIRWNSWRRREEI